jgi:anti-sigma factor RsiW
MTCDRTRALLPEYLDGALTAAEQFGVQAHLEACAACAGECEAQRRVIRLLADTPRPTLGPDWDAALRARLASLAPGRASGLFAARRRLGWGLALVPATAALLFLCLWRPSPAPRPVVSTSERAYVSRLVGQHVAGARARDLPEQEAVDVALHATSLGSLIE